ncbi:MAG: aminotransferase, partial [Bacteroidetes bacterium HGW-Bacteroidetes-23]
MIATADRLNSVQEYYFSKKLREVNQMLSEGKPIINMGIGSPDLLPHFSVVNAIQNSMNDKKAHEYQSYQGLPELRKAMTTFYQNQFNVSMDFASEVLTLMGSKEGIMHV